MRGLKEENENPLHLALKAAKVAVWDWDLPTDKIYWAREFSDALGLSLSKVRSGRAWLQRIHPDDSARLQNVVTVALNEKREYRVEYRMALGLKQFRWVEERGLGAYDNRGRCV